VSFGNIFFGSKCKIFFGLQNFSGFVKANSQPMIDLCVFGR
jgi:hypothetical protein